MKPRFTNSVKVLWFETKRDMKLLEDISFIDSKGVVWTAPEGSVINGASIPRIAWRIIGSPYVGLYRRASVIHDVFCVTMARPHKNVHKMFRDAMLCDKVSKPKAATMYAAVRAFGPKW